jgi:hypothetical protein
MSLRAFALSAVLVVSTGSLCAQTLADVARKEEERRKTLKETGKVYTNKDLQPVAVPDVLPPDSTDPATPAAPGGDAAAPATGADAAKPAAPAETGKEAAGTPEQGQAAAKDEAYWRGRMTALQTQLSRDQAFADALQVQIDALNTDFANRDDPAARSVVAANRQKALDEIARVKKAIEDTRQSIEALQEEARRAGVPPGWLR